MRVLFVTSPGLGHNFPLVPLAWALRAAGHDVLWSASADTAVQAGLPAVDPAPGTDWGALFQGFFGRHPERAADMTATDMATRLDFVAALFADVSEPAVDGTVALAKQWRPDVVVHSPLQGAGPLAAATVGVPAVLHAFSPDTDSPEFGSAIAGHLAAAYARHGAAPAPPAAVVSVAPASLGGSGAGTWPMRYVAYNGGTRVPSWLTEPGPPRVAVTLGSVVPGTSGTGALGDLLDAAGSVDAEFVLALGGADMGTLAPNVRSVDWLPLSVLLPACAAVIHHGGAGTTMTAFDAGIPQLVLPHGADQFRNSELVGEVGTGLAVRGEDLTAERVTAVLADTALRAAAARVAAEMHAMPAPADLVPRLATLV